MDFNRGNRPTPVGAPHPGAGHQPTTQQQTTSGNGSNKFSLDNYRISWLVLLFSATILVVLTLIFLGIGGKNRANIEARSVNTDLKQAVFLNGGQVYFGSITDLSSEHFRLNDIYYLRVNQQVQPEQGQQQTGENDISLVKLGCELHGPQDEMFINRDQVIFWENLKADGQVAQAISEYKAANPEGQDCNQQQGSTTNPDPADGTAPAGSDEAQQGDTSGAPAPTPATP